MQGVVHPTKGRGRGRGKDVVNKVMVNATTTRGRGKGRAEGERITQGCGLFISSATGDSFIATSGHRT